jgi:hypothetical protein
MATPEELDDEDRRVRELRTAVQLTFSVIAQTDMPLADAEAMVEAVRHTAMRLFPGKESVFDLIYLPRFRRLLADRYPTVRLGAPRACEAS